MATESLKFESGLGTTAYERGIKTMINGAEGAASKVKSAFSKLSGPLDSLGGKLGGMLAGGAVLAGLNELTSSMSELGKMAAGVPLDPERYQRLGAAFMDAGVEGDDFAEMLRATKAALSDAKEEGSDAAMALRMLGLSQEQITRGNVEEAVMTMADSFKLAGDDARVFAAASTALGEDLMAKVIPTLAKGSEHLRTLGKDAKIASRETIEAAAQMEAARNKFFTEANNVIANEVFAKGETIKVHLESAQELNPGGVMGGIQTALAAVVGVVDALTGGHMADTISRDRMDSGPVSDEAQTRYNEEQRARVKAQEARDRLERESEEKKSQQETFAAMQERHVEWLDDMLKNEEEAAKKRVELSKWVADTETETNQLRAQMQFDALSQEEKIAYLEKQRYDIIGEMLKADKVQHVGLENALVKLDQRIEAEKEILEIRRQQAAVKPPDLPVLSPQQMRALTRDNPAQDRREANAERAARRRFFDSPNADRELESQRRRFDFDNFFGKSPIGPTQSGRPLGMPQPRNMRERDKAAEMAAGKVPTMALDDQTLTKLSTKIADNMKASLPK